MADTQTPTIKPKLASLCKELVGLLGLRQGSVEIHCHKGRPQQLHFHKPVEDLGEELSCIVHDKSIKFDEPESKP